MIRIVALVGVDGAGKTTQARMLADWLTARGIPADYRQNAGGRRWFGRLARRLRRRDADDLLGRRGMLLVEAALRWLAIAWALLRARQRGRVAVMDRYSCCQYASIRARGGRGERLARRFFGVFPEPDLTCFLELAPGEAYRRIEARGTDHEDIGHLAAADAAYRSLPETAGFVVIDASAPPAEVAEQLRRAVLAFESRGVVADRPALAALGR
jgi:dTMP kinase